MKTINLIKILILIVIVPISINAKTITLKWLESKPRSIERDFYIWQYLQQSNINEQQANKALSLSKKVNLKIFNSFLKVSANAGNNEIARILQCYNLKASELFTKDANCFYIGFSISKASKLSEKNIYEYMNMMQANNHTYEYEVLKVLGANDVFFALKLKDVDDFIDIYTKVSRDFRHKYLNRELSVYHLDELKQSKKFSRLLNVIITDFKMTQAQKSLLKIKIDHLDYDSSFLIAINAIRYDEIKIALQALDLAYNKTHLSYKRDKVNFWRYLLTTQDKYLVSLINSKHINIYSMWAREKRNKPPTNIKYTTSFAKHKGINPNFDVQDPFVWRNVRLQSRHIADSGLKKLNALFSYKRDQGYNAYLLNKINSHKNAYFITPFSEILNQLTNERRALINAIARQESRFIPTAISSSYAMGVMQIMPFLSKHLAKELKEPYNIYDMLNDRTNLRYANKHLDFLTYRLKHVLFLAYAYNAGIGYTRRMLKNKNLFTTTDIKKYEPFLSMELVSYPETREYGKAVLVNYLIYINHLNNIENKKLKRLYEISIKSLATKSTKDTAIISIKESKLTKDLKAKLHKKVTLKELLDTAINPHLDK